MPRASCVIFHSSGVSSRPWAVSRQPWSGFQAALAQSTLFSVSLPGLAPGFLNIAPDNKKGLLGMAAAPVQLLGCLSGRGRSRTDRQSVATAVQNPMLPLSTQAGRASGVGFLSQPWCRQMLPGRGKGLVLKRGSTLRCLQRGRDTCGKLGDPGQIFQDLKTEMGMLISKKEIKQTTTSSYHLKGNKSLFGSQI